ncbi:MAG: histidine phosphatase family protein [Clostridia bacterium]|nr:histidine phosphatase family protein [Clostridia bacterium]
MKTTLIVVRHGYSEGNRDTRFVGHGDVPLTEIGHAQALCTADYLKGWRIDRIYSSDLCRAMQTAIPVAKMHGLPIYPMEELREIYAGEWEGGLYAELLEKYPESYGKWIRDIGNAHPDGGESVAEMAARVYAAVDRIVQENEGKCVAIFTHGTPARVLGCRWHQLPLSKTNELPFCGNASVSIAEYESDGSWRLIQYGYDGHQGENATRLPANV